MLVGMARIYLSSGSRRTPLITIVIVRAWRTITSSRRYHMHALKSRYSRLLLLLQLF